MKQKRTNPFMLLFALTALAGLLKFGVAKYLEHESTFINWLAITAIICAGVFIIQRTAKIIEETTSVLKNKTGLAGGMLQSFGTAFPDMVLGVTAAIMSLGAAATNQTLAINYAIIAASTTFGSNIYNIGYATWGIYRQNLANLRNKEINIFPFIGKSTAKPMKTHLNKPYIIEMNTAIKVLVALTVLTTFVVLGMVFFGKVNNPIGFSGDLYQLKREIGVLLLFLCVGVLYMFRKNYGAFAEDRDNHFAKLPMSAIWIALILSGVAILFTAEAMVESISRFSVLASVPIVLAGAAAGAIGCLSEMMVVHNFIINPDGRIGDAVVGVAMDNIITIIGASSVAILGGIFLGGDSLIVIFVIILSLNSLLIWQISDLKDEYIEQRHLTAHLKNNE